MLLLVVVAVVAVVVAAVGSCCCWIVAVNGWIAVIGSFDIFSVTITRH